MPGATPNLGKVVAWMTGALLSFSVSALSVRALASTLNISEILAIRTGFGLAVMVLLALTIPALRRTLKPRRMPMHLARNSVHYVGQFFWAWGLTVLPFATVFALEFTMPMWVALLAVPLLGERMTPSRIGSIVFGLLGVIVIIRPGASTFQPAALLVLIAALGYALSIIATKKLTSDVGAFAIIFWMNAIQFPLTMAGSDPLFLTRIGEATWLPALGMGVAGLTSHFCLTKAFTYGDASVVTPLDFLRIPLIAVVGWMFYSEALDAWVFAGAGLIILGVLWNLRAESRRTPIPLVAAATEEAHSGNISGKV